jgi:hypothetical protein
MGTYGEVGVYVHSLLTSELGKWLDSDSGRSSTSTHWTMLIQVSLGNNAERKVINIDLHPEDRGSIFHETLFTYCIELSRNQ